MLDKKPLATAITSIILTATSLDIGAQAEAETRNERALLEEVVVTARKREESLFDVPTAVSSFSQTMLDNLRLADARDMLTLVPTAYLQENNAGTARDISIRGVGTPSIFAESGVATYIDEVYSSGFISYPTQFYDLKRIEVLRGPQGALYGRNAVGGALNILSQQPEDTFGGSVRGTIARYEREELEGIINIPVTDNFRTRVVGWYTNQDKGEYKNPFTGDYIDANDSKGGRFVADYSPTDELSLSFVAETTDAKAGGTSLFFPMFGESENNVPRDTQPRNEFDTTRYAGQLNYDTSVGTFTAVVGYREYSLEGIEDTDLTADNPFDLLLGQLGKQVTIRENEVDSTYVELRWLSPELGRFSILAGVNYLDESATGDTVTDLPTVSEQFSGGVLPAELVLKNDQGVESYAGFIEVTVSLSDTLSLIGSTRYTRDEKSVDFAFEPTDLMVSLLGPAEASKTDKTFTNWSPGGTLVWTPSDDTNLYAKVQTGFRAGGYNFNVASIDNLPYDEETSINYELGGRQQFLDGAAIVGLNIYFMEQDDVLVPLFDFSVPGPLGGYLANNGKSETIGVELEANFQVSEGLNLMLSGGWLDAEFTEGTDANGNSLDGNKLPSSREWTYAIVGSYRTPLTEDIELLIDSSYTYRDSGYNDIANLQPISDAKLLNASIGIAFSAYELSAYVKNALDDQYDLAFGFRPPGELGVTRAEGTTFGAIFKANF
ncbi:MAG: TonB-dependent receptor [Pseudomonadota bacterium]